MNLLPLLLIAQIHGPFQVVKQGGNVYLIPQGIVKSGPRLWSAFDPSNPQSSVIAPPAMLSLPRQRVFPSVQPMGKSVVILNPFVTSSQN
jgi:hypothetical protein